LLLVSTYELGHQPVHVANAAAALASIGLEVETVDLSVEPMPADLVKWADAVAFSVPMHTAMRLATATAAGIREENPALPIAFFGLYASVGSDWTIGALGASAFSGEYLNDLVAWAGAVATGSRPSPVARVSLERQEPLVPDRRSLPAHDRYARLEFSGENRVAAAVEATHGCRHRCRHCPIPVLYDGRLRVVGAGPILSDIANLAADGVEHVTFADPDFLNAPRYSLDLLREAHAAHPSLTFDVTVKVEHVLAHRALWPEMARLGVLFVTSAFESVDNATLRILDKGHTVADMREARSVIGASGISIRPTWLPFLPWTTPGDLADLVRFLDEEELWAVTDPVQLAIRLLLPEGSLLEAHPAVIPHLIRYDPLFLTWIWEFATPATSDLHRRLDTIAADGSDCGASFGETLVEMRRAIADVSGADLGPMPPFADGAPRLTESWFCCAEPTAAQATAVTIGR
jgi:radical SAM superfamily enzyme YgiQ (UPF0313 family)